MSDSPHPKPERKSSIGHRLVKYVFLILLCVCAGLYIWKLVDEASLSSGHKEDIDSLVAGNRKLLDMETRKLLRLSGMTFGWSVRSELLKGNLEQINDYFNQYIMEPRIRRITLIRNDGKVTVSTDAKMEGKDVSSLYRDTLAAYDNIGIDEGGEQGMLRMFVPVTGYNSRLATLVIEYQQADSGNSADSISE